MGLLQYGKVNQIYCFCQNCIKVGLNVLLEYTSSILYFVKEILWCMSQKISSNFPKIRPNQLATKRCTLFPTFPILSYLYWSFKEAKLYCEDDRGKIYTRLLTIMKLILLNQFQCTTVQRHKRKLRISELLHKIYKNVH